MDAGKTIEVCNCIIKCYRDNKRDGGKYFEIKHKISNEILHAMNYTEAIRISKLLDIAHKLNNLNKE